MSKYCLLTNDVETTSIWFNSLRDKTGIKVYREGMPLLLDIYAKYNIKTTFFFTAYIAKLVPDVVRMVLKYGHEVASHGKSHLPENGFDVMHFKKQKEHLKYSKKLLEDISGNEVISFRAPALRVSNETAKALIETGFKIDSSIASQRFDFFLSFGGKNKLKWFLAPRLPYKVDPENIFKKGNSDLVEVPLSAFFLPYVGTTMRIFPKITYLQRLAIHFETKLNGKPVVFDIHPNEFIDESHEKRIISRRTSNYLSFFFKDWIRSNLKIKNLGPVAAKLYIKQIEFYKNRNYQFTTIRKYCEMDGLI
ncbi:polysaccharide deacetylase family protein [Calditrichota bacterium LG25]